MIPPFSTAKQKFVDTALELFSERGYFGVSLADVAGELGLTKQSVIYHFKTKDALYGAVIADIACRLESILAPAPRKRAAGDEPLDIYLQRIFAHMRTHRRDARLISRELLDNLDRTETGQTWYLKRFLDESVALVASHPKWQRQSTGVQTAAAYQLIGAVSYYAISDATLRAIWGQDRLEDLDEAFLPALMLLLDH